MKDNQNWKIFQKVKCKTSCRHILPSNLQLKKISCRQTHINLFTNNEKGYQAATTRFLTLQMAWWNMIR